jgi:hypothetical protein
MDTETRPLTWFPTEEEARAFISKINAYSPVILDVVKATLGIPTT